jgi:C_GCAxxG_C_C family probable redox protein
MEDGIMNEKDVLLLFNSGYNCAQAVLSRFAERYGMSRDDAFRIGTGFGGGIARNGEACGAVTGAVMALGLRYGQREGDDRSIQENTYEKVNEFLELFRALHSSCVCRVILDGIDLKSSEGQMAFRDQNKMDVCCRCVVDAVRIVESMV